MFQSLFDERLELWVGEDFSPRQVTEVGGMLIGMICQIFIVPALFVIFQYLQEKVKPMEWEDIDNTDAVTEIEQYAK